MLILGHRGEPILPHDLWSAWEASPIVVVPLGLVITAYVSGMRLPTESTRRRAAFAGGVAALTVALVSPLEAMSATLVSAHMVQHMLLALVAAPLLAISAPGAAILRGTPHQLRTVALRARRAARLDAARLRRLRSPVMRWLLYVITLWSWHASLLYGAAVDNDGVHALEHALFLGAGYLVWSSILGPDRVRISPGLGLLAVFTLGMQSTFLSALLTFAPEPWYQEFITPPEGWGLTPLADQQLAGVLLWVPGGFFHLALSLWLLVRWLQEGDEDGPDTRCAIGQHDSARRAPTTRSTVGGLLPPEKWVAHDVHTDPWHRRNPRWP